VVLPQLQVTELKLVYLKTGFEGKKKGVNTDNFLHHSSSTLSSPAQVLTLEYGCKSHFSNKK